MKTASEVRETNTYSTGMIKVQVEYVEGRLANVYVRCRIQSMGFTPSEARELRQILMDEGTNWPAKLA